MECTSLLYQIQKRSLAQWRQSLLYLFDARGVILTRHPNTDEKVVEILAAKPVLRFVGRKGNGDRGGVDLEGFAGVMSRTVVGVWGWESSLDLGVALEVDRDEAFSLLKLYRNGTLVIVVVAVLAVASLLLIYLRSRIRSDALQSQMQTLLNDVAALVLVTNNKGKIVRASDSALRLFGRNVLEGKSYRDIVPMDIASLWSEQDAAVRNQERNLETTESLVVQGAKRWFRFERTPWRDSRGFVLGVVSVGWDITDYRKSEMALMEYQHGVDDVVRRQTFEVEREKQRLQNIMDVCTDAIVSIDQRGVILFCNQAMERLFHFSSGELLGQNIALLMDDDIALQHPQFMEKHAVSGQDRVLVGRWRKIVARTRDKQPLPVEISVGTYVQGENLHFVGVVRDLTERQRTDELKEVLFENSHDGYLVLENDVIVDCNATMISMLDLVSKSDLIHRRMQDISTGLQPDGAASAEKYDRLLRFAREQGSARFDWRIKKFDGSAFFVEVNLKIVWVGEREFVLAVLHDIGERIATQNAIRRSEQRIRDIMDSTQQLMCLLTPDGNILEANQAAYRLAGASADAIIGRKLWDAPWWHNSREMRSLLRERLINAVNGEHGRFATPLWDRDGKLLHIDFAMTPIMQDEQVELIVVEGHDVTAINEARDAERQAREDAEAANQAKGEFLAKMSHEIRTPMNAIIGMTRLCLNTSLTERQRQYLTSVDNAANSLLGIVNDILDFSKIEAGKLELELISYSLRDVFTNVGDVIGLKAQEKNLEFVINDVDVPARVVGDPLRLQQVLINLCSNAVKFTEKGYVELEVSRIMTSAHHVRMRFQVRDTGIGMSQEDQEKLFESFSQADASISRKYGGTGLGLSICRQLVNAMGGDIQVQSRLGEGSVFSFELPLQLDDKMVPAKRTYAPKTRGNQQVLVVDDNPVCWKIEERILVNAGYRVKVAESGEQALDWLIQQGHVVDLLVLDWDLPDMTGRDVMARLQATLTDNMPPVLLVTAYGQDDILKDADYKPQGFLSKPIHSAELVDMVDRILYQRPSMGAPASAIFSSPLGQDALKPRILLVEDNEINRFLVIENLQSLGVELDTAENGKEALERLRARDYDLVLMDLQMPVMDGFDCCIEIRKQYGAQRLPVIAMTANAFTRERQRAAEVGMNAFVTKPFETADLIQTIVDHLPQRMNEWKQWVLSHHSMKMRQMAPVDLVPGINLAAALARVHNNRQAYRKLLEEYLDHFGQVGSALSLLHESGMTEQCVELAHKLKGVAGNLGFEDLSAAAASLEQVDASGAIESMATLINDVKRLNSVVLQGIEAFLQNTQNDAASSIEAPNWTDTENAQCLDRVRAQLRVSDVVQDQDITRLRAILAPHASVGALDDLCYCIENFDSARALHLLDEITAVSGAQQ